MTITSVNPTLVRRRLAEINAEAIQWLWPPGIATKLNLIGGHPGLGESQITIAIAAVVSRGGRWPDDTECQQGSVILISSEDDASDTIKPRLEAAGADTRHVHVIDAVLDDQKKPRSWRLDDHEVIDKLITELGDVRLIVIDPVTAYVGGKDGHSTSDVRGLLSPLMDLASREKFAILAVSHLNKSGKDEAITRVIGSLAYVAAARAAFIVGRHPTIEDARCLAPLKNNLGDDKTGFGYRVVSATSHDGFSTSRIEWIPGAIEVSAHDVLAKPPGKPEDIDTYSAKDDEAAFLINILKDGPVPSVSVYESADAADISKRTLSRAKKSLLVRSIKVDGKSGWHMQLPEREQGCQSALALARGNLVNIGYVETEESQECQECQECQEGLVPGGAQVGTLENRHTKSSRAADGNLYPTGWGAPADEPAS